MKINQPGTSVITPTTTRGERKTRNLKPNAFGERVSISSEARQIEQARQKLESMPDLRDDRIQDAQVALADGSLESDEAIDQALDSLVADLL